MTWPYLGRRPALRLLDLIAREIVRQPEDLRRHLAGRLETELDFAVTPRRVRASVGEFPVVDSAVEAILESTDDPESN